MEITYNPQSYAYSIECILREKGLASYHDADEITRSPIDFLDARLSIYEINPKDIIKLLLIFGINMSGIKGNDLMTLTKNLQDN